MIYKVIIALIQENTGNCYMENLQKRKFLDVENENDWKRKII